MMKVLISIPVSHHDRLLEIWHGKFDFFTAGCRYLFRQEILRNGPMPTPTSSRPKAGAVSPPAGRPGETPAPTPPTTP